MLYLLTLSLVLSFSQCSKSIDPDDIPRIDLTAENVGATEVWLRFTYTGFSDPREFAIERDGQRIAAGVLQKPDTLIMDTTALAKHSYTYKAIRLERGSATIINASVQVTTLDTTSHNVTWQVDTLGVRGTIFDVWAFSKDNIWAVGEIYLKDSTGKEDPSLYNAARWDGSRWQNMRIPVQIFGGSIGLDILRTIFAFSPTDIWTFSNAGSYVHWDGTQWKTEYVPQRQGGGLKLWGLSSSNLYLVGTNGSISHYNGTAWQKMESGTTVDLEDIWGLDENHIWATGTKTDLSRSVVLQYNGKNWSTLYDSFGRPPSTALGFSSVWTDNANLLYLGGVSGRWSMNIKNTSFRRLERIAGFQTYCERATAQNDIYASGAASDLLHYNGASWYRYPEIKALGGGNSFWYSVFPRKESVTVGGEFFTGLFGVPVVIRGVR